MQQSGGAAWAVNRDTTCPMLAAASHAKCAAHMPWCQNHSAVSSVNFGCSTMANNQSVEGFTPDPQPESLLRTSEACWSCIGLHWVHFAWDILLESALALAKNGRPDVNFGPGTTVKALFLPRDAWQNSESCKNHQENLPTARCALSKQSCLHQTHAGTTTAERPNGLQFFCAIGALSCHPNRQTSVCGHVFCVGDFPWRRGQGGMNFVRNNARNRPSCECADFAATLLRIGAQCSCASHSQRCSAQRCTRKLKAACLPSVHWL